MIRVVVVRVQLDDCGVGEDGNDVEVGAVADDDAAGGVDVAALLMVTMVQVTLIMKYFGHWKNT